MGRPAVDSELVRFRAERSMLEGIDRFANDKELHADGPLKRAEAVRRIIQDWLIGSGYIRGDADG